MVLDGALVYVRNSEGKAELRAKKWSGPDAWVPGLDQPGLVLLKSLPTEPPKLIKPCHRYLDFEKMCKSIEKVYEVGALTPGAFEEWQNVLDNEKALGSNWDSIPMATRDSGDKSELDYYLDSKPWVVELLLQGRNVCLPVQAPAVVLHPCLERAMQEATSEN